MFLVDSLGWWPFPFGISCDLVAKQRLLPSQKLRVENYPSSLLVLIPVLSLILSSCCIFFCPLYFWCALCRTCFGFTLILTPQLFPGAFFIPHPTFGPEETAWGAFQTAMEKVECVLIHIKRLLGNFSGPSICGAGFTLGSSKPASCAMPGQRRGTRAPPSRLLLLKPSLTWFWPTPRSPGLRHSLPRLWHWPDCPQLAVWMQLLLIRGERF